MRQGQHSVPFAAISSPAGKKFQPTIAWKIAAAGLLDAFLQHHRIQYRLRRLLRGRNDTRNSFSLNQLGTSRDSPLQFPVAMFPFGTDRVNSTLMIRRRTMGMRKHSDSFSRDFVSSVKLNLLNSISLRLELTFATNQSAHTRSCLTHQLDSELAT